MAVTFQTSLTFPNADLFAFGMEFLELTDIFHSARVCKLWSDFSSEPCIWKRLFEIEGIPQVSNLTGLPRDYKADFRALYPITISRKMICQYLGEMVGEIPCIGEKYFNALKEPDPFERGKLKAETFVFVVEPHYIKRFADQKAPFKLGEDNNLIVHPTVNERELLIPFSLINLVMLSSYPLDGEKNKPVVNPTSYPEVLRQCNACAKKVSVYFMRKQYAQGSMGTPSYQDQFVRREGFGVASLRVRALFDFILILKTGTCPDACDQSQSEVRISDVVKIDSRSYQAAIGGFAAGKGLRITYYITDQIGIVPCISL